MKYIITFALALAAGIFLWSQQPVKEPATVPTLKIITVKPVIRPVSIEPVTEPAATSYNGWRIKSIKHKPDNSTQPIIQPEYKAAKKHEEPPVGNITPWKPLPNYRKW